MKEPSQAKHLLSMAADEIKRLRRENELMSARLDMFDACQAMLHTKVAHREYGASPDVVHMIETHLNEKGGPIPPLGK